MPWPVASGMLRARELAEHDLQFDLFLLKSATGLQRRLWASCQLPFAGSTIPEVHRPSELAHARPFEIQNELFPAPDASGWVPVMRKHGGSATDCVFFHACSRFPP